MRHRDRRIDRRTFLRNVGVRVAVGTGLGLGFNELANQEEKAASIESTLSADIELSGRVDEIYQAAKDYLGEFFRGTDSVEGYVEFMERGCKKIRDDKGSWSQVEDYLRKHSDLEFTHELCPEFIEKYYPEKPAAN